MSFVLSRLVILLSKYPPLPAVTLPIVLPIHQRPSGRTRVPSQDPTVMPCLSAPPSLLHAQNLSLMQPPVRHFKFRSVMPSCITVTLV